MIYTMAVPIDASSAHLLSEFTFYLIALSTTGYEQGSSKFNYIDVELLQYEYNLV